MYQQRNPLLGISKYLLSGAESSRVESFREHVVSLLPPASATPNCLWLSKSPISKPKAYKRSRISSESFWPLLGQRLTDYLPRSLQSQVTGMFQSRDSPCPLSFLCAGDILHSDTRPPFGPRISWRNPHHGLQFLAEAWKWAVPSLKPIPSCCKIYPNSPRVIELCTSVPSPQQPGMPTVWVLACHVLHMTLALWACRPTFQGLNGSTASFLKISFPKSSSCCFSLVI